ncbi:MAG TPA: DUF4112 domain-containing protein [Gemmatimonadales bacterium]|nr:DUF4112 domain-containing protein [Gemmatimonadales bacterium]
MTGCGPPGSRQLARFGRIARALDARWRLPYTPFRFGWDAILGIVPGLGDALAGAIGAYGLYAGWRLGAPPVVLARLLLNLAVGVVVGSIPLLGDLFDVAFRSNLRNFALLERWLAEPHRTRRRSRWLFAGLVAGVAAALMGAILIALWMLTALLSALRR